MSRTSTRFSPGSRSDIPSSRSTSSKAASRTTRSSSRRNNLRTVAAAPIRVLLVEDNQVFSEALELLLGLQEDIQVVGAVGEGQKAVEAVLELVPDVIVMDYRLPGIDGVQATRAVRAAAPGVAVVCLTA